MLTIPLPVTAGASIVAPPFCALFAAMTVLHAESAVEPVHATMHRMRDHLIERFALIWVQYFLKFCGCVRDARQFLGVRRRHVGVQSCHACRIGLSFRPCFGKFEGRFQCLAISLPGRLLRSLDFQPFCHAGGQVVRPFLAMLGPILFHCLFACLFGGCLIWHSAGRHIRSRHRDRSTKGADKEQGDEDSQLLVDGVHVDSFAVTGYRERISHRGAFRN